MEVIDLIWKDNVTEYGKQQGMFELIAKGIKYFDYRITNYPFYGAGYDDKFYMTYNNDTTKYDTLEEAKEAAQNHFKELIFKTYFK